MAQLRLTTRAEIRRRAARRLDDLVRLQATEAGTSSTLIDTINMSMGNEDLVRRQIVFTDPTFAPARAVVTSHAHSDSTISFNPPLGGSTSTTTTCDLFNKRGMGFSIMEYDDAINSAIDDSFPIARTIVESTTTTFNDASPTLSVGADTDDIYDVLWQDGDGEWRSVPAAEYEGYSGWYSRPYDEAVVVSGGVRNAMAGRSVKVIGYGKHPQLTTDTATTALHPEWLVARVCYHLCLMGLNRDATGMRAKQVLTFQQESESRLTLIRTRHNPMSSGTRA